MFLGVESEPLTVGTREIQVQRRFQDFMVGGVDVLIVALVADEGRFGCGESPGSNRVRSRTRAG
jgi:hypothetical protein